MRARASYVVVGLFVLILGATLIAGILWLTAGGPPRNYEYYYVYMTESVSGLNVDAAVSYKGVNRGRVKDIDLDPRDPSRVRLLLTVLEGTPIDRDTVATLEYQGLTGIASVDLSGSSGSAPRLVAEGGDRYPVIPSEPSLLARLDKTVSDLLGSLIETSSRVSALLDEQNLDRIGGTLGALQSLVTSLEEHSRRLGTLFDGAEQTLGNVSAATNGLPELIDQFRRSAGSLEHMANALAETGASVQETGAALQESLTASGRDLQRFTGTALPQAGDLIAELRLAAANLRRVSEQLEHDPRSLLFGPASPRPGPGEADGGR